MESLSSIIAIAVVIIASVAGMTIAQKQEQARAIIVQKVAKYKYRANEAGRILENFASIPIGVESRKLLLQYALLNLSAASQLKHSDPVVARNIVNIQAQLEDPSSPVDSQTLTIPQDITNLNVILSKLTTLGKYLQKFRAIKAMNSPSIPIAVGKLNLLIAEIKINAFVQQAKASMSNHELVNAQKHLQTARQMLDRVTNKNSRLTRLEQEIKELTSKKIVPRLAKVSKNNVSKNKQLADEQSEDNDIFGPKKKW